MSTITRRAAGSWLPTAAVLAAVCLWGSSFVGTKLALRVFDPFAVIWARMLFSSLLFLAILPRLDRPRYCRGDWRGLLLLVVFLPGLYFPLENTALTLTSASQAGMISAIVPLLVAVGAHFVFGERVTVRGYAGLAAAIVGVVWLTLAAESSLVSAPNPLLGNFLEFLAMLCACGYMLTIKKLSERYGTWMLSGLQCLAGLVFFLPAVFRFESALTSPELTVGIGAVAYLGIVVTLLAFGFYNYGVSRMPASRASAFINLIPVVSVFLGWAILGDSLTVGQYEASVLVMSGVALSQFGARKARIADSK